MATKLFDLFVFFTKHNAHSWVISQEHTLTLAPSAGDFWTFFFPLPNNGYRMKTCMTANNFPSILFIYIQKYFLTKKMFSLQRFFLESNEVLLKPSTFEFPNVIFLKKIIQTIVIPVLSYPFLAFIKDLSFLENWTS